MVSGGTATVVSGTVTLIGARPGGAEITTTGGAVVVVGGARVVVVVVTTVSGGGGAGSGEWQATRARGAVARVTAAFSLAGCFGPMVMVLA